MWEENNKTIQMEFLATLFKMDPPKKFATKSNIIIFSRDNETMDISNFSTTVDISFPDVQLLLLELQTSGSCQIPPKNNIFDFHTIAHK